MRKLICVGVHILARRPSRRRGHRVLAVLFRPARRPGGPEAERGVYQSAYAHIMGRTAYEGMLGALPTADHQFSSIMNAAGNVVFSLTLKMAEVGQHDRRP